MIWSLFSSAFICFPSIYSFFSSSSWIIFPFWIATVNSTLTKWSDAFFWSLKTSSLLFISAYLSFSFISMACLSNCYCCSFWKVGILLSLSEFFLALLILELMSMDLSLSAFSYLSMSEQALVSFMLNCFTSLGLMAAAAFEISISKAIGFICVVSI